MRSTHRPSNLFRYSPLVAALACAIAPQVASAVSLAVTNTADAGPGSFRAALQSCSPGDTVDFVITATPPPHVITISSLLPDVTCSGLRINAVSPQPVQLVSSGFSYGSTPCGGGSLAALYIPPTVSGVEVVNLDISGFSGPALCGSVKAKDNTLHGNGFGIYFTGPGAADNNTIFDNSNSGIRVAANVSVPITSNKIFGNAKNIDLNGGAPLTNDPGDPDSGPNNGLNTPIVQSVTQSGGNTTIVFDLDVPLNQNYFLQFFANDGPGIPAGQHYQGDYQWYAASNGSNVGITTTVPGTFDHVSMTATLGSPGNFVETSEFSPQKSAVAGPAVSISPANTDFGFVSTGSASAPRTITLTSEGGVPWTLYELSSDCDGAPMCSGSPYMCSTTCVDGQSYAPGTSCTITATFAPIFTGTQYQHIKLCGNTATTPETILSGTGVTPPPITITPDQWDFGRVLVSKSSEPHSFQVNNPGTSPISLGPVSTQGDFVLLSTTCGASLPGPGACSADVAFRPTQPGPATGSLVVPVSTAIPPGPSTLAKRAAKSAPATSATAALYGTGVQQADLEMPSILEFGVQVVGANPVVRTAELRNTGNAFLTFASITITGANYTMTNGCPLNLAPGDSCLLTISFSAPAPGEYAGQVSVTSNASGGLRTIALGALAQLVARPVILVAPVTMGFGDRIIGTASPTQRVTITNDGGALATLGAITASIDYLVVNTTCGLVLAPQSSCFADVAMRPLGFGSRVGTLTFTSNAEGSPHKVDLNGAGCRPFTTSSNRLGARSNCSP